MRFAIASFVCLLLASGALADAMSRVYEFTWGGAFPGCTNCGGAESAFACSNGIGQWNDGINKLKFYRDVPAGYVLTRASAKLVGTYNCLNTGSSIVGLTLAGYPIDVIALSGTNQCKCGTCDGERVFTNEFYRSGWPGLNYGSGDSNILQVVAGSENPICLSSLSLNATFVKTPQNQVHLTLRANTTSNAFGSCGSSASICNNGAGLYWASSRSNDYSQSLSIDFTDPVGPKGTVIAIDVQVFGSFALNNNGAPLRSWVNNQFINQAVAPRYADGCTVCGGGVVMQTPQPFQFGWPNYNRGGKNTLLLNISRGGNSAYQFAVSRVELLFTVI